MCNACDTCQTALTYCKRQQAAESYLPANICIPLTTIARDDIIIKKLPRDSEDGLSYNGLIRYINAAAAYGGRQNSADLVDGHTVTEDGQTFTIQFPIAEETRPFIYADKTQEIIRHMIALDSGNDPGFRAKKDEVIYAKDFNSLVDHVKKLKLNTGACEACISRCNACNGCQCNCVSSS